MTGEQSLRRVSRPFKNIVFSDRLYQVTVPTVNERLKGIYEDRGLDTGATIRKFRIVQTEGNRQVGRLVEHYGLEAIFSTPEDRVFKNFRSEPIEGRDFSTMDKEFAAGVFPLCEVFSSSTWRSSFNKHHSYSPETSQLWDAFEEQILERFKQYQIPQIVLLKQTPKVAVCQVFEKVNTGGVSLTVFELLTATFAVDNFNLRDDWAERDGRLKRHRALTSLENTDSLDRGSHGTPRSARWRSIRQPDGGIVT